MILDLRTHEVYSDMEFVACDTRFKGVVCSGESDRIRSATGTYDITYTSKTLNELVAESYVDNDFIVVDRNVYQLDTLCFDGKGYMILDATESNKVIETSLAIIDKLHAINFTKRNKLIVIGGGIVQDIGGFAAAIFKRGIPWTLIPTTVLAMTDSAIGSKVSLNRDSKNMIGMFCAPKTICISDFFLNSLSHNDIISGLGEALKLSMIGGTFDEFMKAYATKDYLSAIRIASSVKKLIIEHDEFEIRERKVLNYGHEFAHAIECVTDYKVPHGIAVLFGIVIVNRVFSPGKFSDIEEFILSIIPPSFKDLPISKADFFRHLSNDKKNMGKEYCFILLDSIGTTSLLYVHIDSVREKIVDAMTNLFIFR